MPLIAVAAGLIGLGVGLVVLARTPALWSSTGPVPERDDELLTEVLREHRVTDGPNPRP